MPEQARLPGSTSDGFHTFDELYAYRMAFHAMWVNANKHHSRYRIHKSVRHSSGEVCFGGGWFIVVATLPTGQISNHYKLEHWFLFDCEVRETPDPYDGHTPQIALERMKLFLQTSRPAHRDPHGYDYGL